MEYKYIYKISSFEVFTIEQLSKVLPENFSILKEDGELLLVVEMLYPSIDDEVFYQVQCECDRIYFLTGEQLSPQLKTKINPTGSMTGFVDIGLSALIVARLPHNLDCEQWAGKLLDRQLRLWQYADQPETVLPAKINLLFQIIETKYPDTRNLTDYPEYKDPNVPPHPRTEAKLLRHFVSHQGQPRKELKNYCNYLGVAEGFFNPTNTDHINIVRQKLNFIKDEARRIIDASITRKI